LPFSDYFEEELTFYEKAIQYNQKVQYPLPCDAYLLESSEMSPELHFIINFFAVSLGERPHKIIKIFKRIEAEIKQYA
jgi:hypothetical protein